MKKFFEKHGLGKCLLIMFVLSIILTWIIPASVGADGEAGELVRIGLSDTGNIFYYMIALSIDKVLFLIVLGLFYGVLSKVKSYNALVSKIAKCMKGKEILFAVLTSLFLALLTSFSTATFAVFVFVPFIISIVDEMDLDKMTGFVITFGAILVGSLGAIFGSDGFTWLNYYVRANSAMNFVKIDVLQRVLVFVVAFLLFSFFNINHIIKQKTGKKAKTVAVKEPEKKAKANKNNAAEEKVVVVKTVKKPERINVGLIIILAIVGLVTILGIIDWYGYFGIDIFNKFHESIINLSIGKDFKLIANILGSSLAPFGYVSADYDNALYSAFNLYSVMALLVFATALISLVYIFNFEKFIEGAKEGLKKAGKAVAILVCTYSIYIIFYMSPMMIWVTNKLMPADGTPNINIDYNGSGVAIFNVDTDGDNKADKNLINQDTNKDGKCDINCDTNKDGWPDSYLDFDGDKKITEADETMLGRYTGMSTLNLDVDGDGTPDVNVDTSYNLATNVVAAIISSLFHNELIYTGYLLTGYFTSNFGLFMNIIFLVYLTIHGLLAFLVPNSVLLAVGLTYSEIEYKDWLKYIWKFAVGMLACLLLIFILLLVL